MKAISTSGLLKLIESKKINCKEIYLLFNPNIDYVLLLQGLYDLCRREALSERSFIDIKEAMGITFSYMCLHYPELAKQYINSIRSEYELMAILAVENIHDYLMYYTQKTNNNLEDVFSIKDKLSMIDQIQAEMVGELLIHHWYPLLKKFFSKYKNVLYRAKYLINGWSNPIIGYLLNPDINNALLPTILPVKSQVYKDQYYNILSSSAGIETFIKPIRLKKVGSKTVTDFETLNEKFKILEKLDLIITYMDQIKEPIPERLYPTFSIPINLKAQDIDLSKISFKDVEDQLLFESIDYFRLNLCIGYRDGEYQILWEDKQEKKLYTLAIGSMRSNNKKRGRYSLFYRYENYTLLTRYEDYLITQIKNAFEKSGYTFKVKAPELIWCDMYNPLIEQLLKIYENKKEGNQ